MIVENMFSYNIYATHSLLKMHLHVYKIRSATKKMSGCRYVSNTQIVIVKASENQASLTDSKNSLILPPCLLYQTIIIFVHKIEVVQIERSINSQINTQIAIVKVNGNKACLIGSKIHSTAYLRACPSSSFLS